MDNPFLILVNRLNRIEELLLDMKHLPPIDSKSSISTTEIIDVKQAALFMGLAVQTVYQHIHKIPHFKRHGKLYFRRSDLIAYLEEGVVRPAKTTRRK